MNQVVKENRSGSPDPTGSDFRCGYIGIVGRPNTGKSSLFNQLIGSHLSGVSAKAQTTRVQTLAWLNLDDGIRRGQLVFLDTPGLPGGERGRLASGMKQRTMAVFEYAHILLMMVDCRRWYQSDEEILKLISRHYRGSVLLLMNKIDLLGDKSSLLPRIASVSQQHDWADIVPISVKRNNGLERLLQSIWQLLPSSPPYYSVTGNSLLSQEAIASEHIRENIYRFLHRELPYRMSVVVSDITERDGAIHVNADIYTDRRHRRAIVIGRQGRTLALIRRNSETSLEKLYDSKYKFFVHLEVLVRSSKAGAADE